VKQKLEPAFVTEAQMCAAFMEWIRPQGWTPYPETAGYDILLAHSDGTQIGVHAKLRFNIDVLCQLSDFIVADDRDGPDFRAVLVPSGAADVLCTALGFIAFEWDRHDRRFTPDIENRRYYGRAWHYWNPKTRCALPRFVPDVPAGEPAPTRLTEWKISALGIAALLELRGHVTRKDFQFYRIDYRRWAQDWLVAGPVTGAWTAGPHLPNFAKQHPVVYPQVRAEVEERLRLTADLAA
jgi:hypothetical protein